MESKRIQIASEVLLQYLEWAKSVRQTEGIMGVALYHAWLTSQLSQLRSGDKQDGMEVDNG